MKPDKEEFTKAYNDIDGNKTTKVKMLAVKYGKTVRTIYRWTDEMVDEVSDVVDAPEDDKKNWSDWVDDYTDPEDEYPEYEQSFTLKNDALIIALADTHFGAKSLKKKLKLLNDLVEKVKLHDNVYIIFTGDLIDYGPSAPRGLDKDQQLKYKYQLEMAEAFYDEIGERIIATASGCHSHFTYNITGDFPERRLAERSYGGIFIGDGGIINLKVGKSDYRIFMSHKLRGGSKRSPALSLLNMAMESHDFDVGITAHNHTASITTRPLRGKHVHFINCGAFKGLDLYARKSGYAPNKNSTPCFYLDSKTKKIQTFMDYEEGIEYLEMKKKFCTTAP